MPKWTICISEARQHTVVASDEDAAISRWLDDSGYEGIRHAARECYCEPSDITAKRITE